MRAHTHAHTHTHTHTFNSLLQDILGKPAPEGSTILDFTEARDDGVAVASAGPYAKSFAPHSRQITTPVPHHLILRAGCSS